HLSYHRPPPPDLDSLSLHDALPISSARRSCSPPAPWATPPSSCAHRTTCRRCRRRRESTSGSTATTSPRSSTTPPRSAGSLAGRSEEHTSELQSHLNIVCRLLLEKK